MSTAVLNRLRADIAELTMYPDRSVGSRGHAAARAWVVDRMGFLGLEPFSGQDYLLPYRQHGIEFANVVGVAPASFEAFTPGAAGVGAAGVGAASHLPVVLGAHYDTVPGTPGADDNAASVAVVFEVAARLLRDPADRPVIIAIFDAEEPPYFHTSAMGSTRFVTDHVRRDVHAAVILDLIAHATPLERIEDLVALMGAESHPAWADTARAVAEGPLPILTLPNRVMPDMSDHRAFRLADRPYLFVTCGQGVNYHRHTDTLANVDLDKTVKVADLVETLVRRAACIPFDGAHEHDSRELDYELLKRAISDEALAYFGVRSAADVMRGLVGLVGLMQDNRSR